MPRSVLTLVVASFLALSGQPTRLAAQLIGTVDEACRTRDYQTLGRNPTRAELRCRFDVRGPGRFGLLSYADVPVYQPATPMPGTHLIGMPGQPRPQPYETFEEWEWRVLRTPYGPEAHRVHRELDMLHPEVARLIVRLETRLAEEGLAAVRRETWRSPQRQAFVFQQGRTRPGPLATTTLTSWHSQMDEQGYPAARAVDYDVAGSSLVRFHQIAQEIGLETFGSDSNDPGHVFLPNAAAVPVSEVVLLRTLPRVPEVTLATGLPVDRSLPTGGREVLRDATLDFASLPFRPFVIPHVVPGRTSTFLLISALPSSGIQLAAAAAPVQHRR